MSPTAEVTGHARADARLYFYLPVSLHRRMRAVAGRERTAGGRPLSLGLVYSAALAAFSAELAGEAPPDFRHRRGAKEGVCVRIPRSTHSRVQADLQRFDAFLTDYVAEAVTRFLQQHEGPDHGQ